MGDAQAAARAVERVAATEQGRLLVVTPLGLRGNPHDPDRLDGTSTTGTDLQVRVGDGHAVYDLTGVTLVRADGTSARLSARVLDVVFTAYGSGAVTAASFDDAELVVTWDPAVAAQAGRTPGTRRTGTSS